MGISVCSMVVCVGWQSKMDNAEMATTSTDGMAPTGSLINPVVVVGSANQDIVVSVDRIPCEGETILGDSVAYLPGGKGLNQACAAASSAHPAYFIGSIGHDEAGAQLLTALGDAGVDTFRVHVRDDISSGTAHILVSQAGGNQIVVVPGANFALTAAEVRQSLESIPGSPVVVLQGEIPLECLVEAAAVTEEKRGRVVLNLAPVMEVPPSLLQASDPLVVNEYEAGLMLGRAAPNGIDAAMEAAKVLLNRSQSVIVTLGKVGSVIAQGHDVIHVAHFDVPEVVDTTGAGDAFVGVLSAQLAAGRDLVESATIATRAAAYSVTRAGASQSYSAIRENFA